MISILVANTKGGCGKTTVATHLAAAFAGAGHRTALADADRQRSSLEWTRLRPGTAAPVAALDWVDGLTAPAQRHRAAGDRRAAAMRKKQVFELVRLADVIIVPVLPSAFDQGSTAAFLARLHELKVDPQEQEAGRHPAQPGAPAHPRGRAAARFLDEIEHADLGGLPDRTVYNEVAAKGLSIFDLSGKRAEQLRADWAPLLGYIDRAG